MADDQIDININVNTKQLAKELSDIQKQSGSLADSFKKVGTVATGVFTAIVALAAKSISEYGKQEEATNRLNQTLANQGIYTKDLSEKYQELASALQKKTLFGDEEILSATAIIQSYSGQVAVTEELIATTLDLAQQTGSVEGAATQVGMAISGASDNIKKLNLDMTGLYTVEERSTEVMRGISAQFKGNAEAATQGAGAYKQLKNTFSDLIEDIGKELLPVVKVLKVQGEELIKVFKSSEGISTFRDIIEGIAIAAVTLKNVFFGLGALIGQQIALIVDRFSILINLGSNVASSLKTAFTDGPAEGLRAMKDSFKTAFTEMKDNVTNTVIDTYDILRNTVKKGEEDIIGIKETFADDTLKIEYEKQEKLKKLNEEAKAKKKEQEEAGRLEEMQAKKEYDEATEELQLISDEKRKNMSQAQYKNMLQYQKTFFSTAATLQTAKNKELAMIGKAAAITQIAIATPPAIAQSIKFGSQFGPYTAIAFGAIAAAAMAVQAANIAGVAVAQGGMINTGFANQDNVPAILEKGEFVAPKESADDIINARAREIAGQNSNNVGVELSLKGDLIKFIEAKILERRAMGVSAI